MAVYLLTIHAYRSWSEDDPRGYVQRGEGLKAPDPWRAKWRSDHADWPPYRFDDEAQRLAHDVVVAITDERKLDLHGCAATATHVHTLVSFRSPACTCGDSEHCRRGCPARRAVEKFLTRLKQKLGQQLAKRLGTAGTGRKYLSGGWDVTPVRDRSHFNHLLDRYLPKHETEEAGVYRRYT